MTEQTSADDGAPEEGALDKKTPDKKAPDKGVPENGREKRPAKAAPAAEAVRWRSYSIDLWWNDLNDVEVGVYAHSRHRAKSRQFTQDSDVIGEVIEDGERAGLVTYREGAWRGEGKTPRRLVVKLFTPAMNWKASLELMTGRSLQLSFGAGGVPVTAFSLVINGHDQIVSLERSAWKLPGFPERFSFFILKDGAPALYRLRRDWIDLRASYTLYDQTGARVGRLRGRLINLGGRWDVTLRKDAGGRELDAVLQLFCAMLRFNARCRSHIAGLLQAVRRGEAVAGVAPEEAALYANPRRLKV